MRYSLIAIFLGTSSLLALPAHAGPGDPGWQIGAAASFGQYDLDDPDFDDSTMGAKAFAQYRFNSLIGIEAAWISTGNFRGDITPGEEGGSVRVDGRGFSANLVGYLPWSPEDVDIFGKIGLSTLDLESNLDGVVATRKADGLTAGAGAQIGIAESFSLRIEGDWYSLKDSSLWTINLGVAYHFGAP